MVNSSILGTSILWKGLVSGVANELRTTRAEGKVAEYVRGLDYRTIGPEVYAGDIQDSMLADISAVCRRAFKKQDVIVYVEINSDDDEYEEGVVFTADGIFHWKDKGSYVIGIKYSEMTKVDYDDTDIIIEHENITTRISLGDDAEEEKYPRHMYSFVMDILESEEKTVSEDSEE